MVCSKTSWKIITTISEALRFSLSLSLSHTHYKNPNKMSEHWRWWLICSLSHYDGNNVIFLNVQLEGQSQLDTSTHPAPSATSETRLTLRRIRYRLINNRTKRTSPSLLLAIQSIFPHISVGLEWLCRFLITRITRHVFEVAALDTFIIQNIHRI